jgi:drug/metabolite transporter superfamily protein YnfA
VLILKTFALFVITAVAEIVGCYLPDLWLRKNGSPWLLIPALLSLAFFAWLADRRGSSDFVGRLWCGRCLAGMVSIVLGSSHG